MLNVVSTDFEQQHTPQGPSLDHCEKPRPSKCVKISLDRFREDHGVCIRSQNQHYPSSRVIAELWKYTLEAVEMRSEWCRAQLMPRLDLSPRIQNGRRRKLFEH